MGFDFSCYFLVDFPLGMNIIQLLGYTEISCYFLLKISGLNVIRKM